MNIIEHMLQHIQKYGKGLSSNPKENKNHQLILSVADGF